MKYLVFLILVIFGGAFAYLGALDLTEAKTVMHQIVALISWAIASIFITGGLVSLALPSTIKE